MKNETNGRESRSGWGWRVWTAGGRVTGTRERCVSRARDAHLDRVVVVVVVVFVFFVFFI